MKQRVLMIIGNELCIAGVPNVIMNIVETLSAFYTFDILTFSTKTGELDAQFLSYGGKIYTIELPRYPECPITCFFAYQILYNKLRRIFRENSYHVVHGHTGCYDGICLRAAQKARIPVRISHAHGEYKWSGRNLLVKYYLEYGKKMISKFATQRVACSDVAGKTLFLHQSFQNLLNPVDVTLYDNKERRPHDGIQLLQIGYFCAGKNQLFSINLLAYILKLGRCAHLSFIGYPSEQKYFEQMQSVIANDNLSDYISFLPRDFDKRKAFFAADYTLLPSVSEGLPLVALESQAAGVPCLMSDNISTYADVGAGFFLPHNNLGEWANTIIRGVNVDSRRLHNNLQKVSKQAYADRIKNLYEQKTITSNE